MTKKDHSSPYKKRTGPREMGGRRVEVMQEISFRIREMGDSGDYAVDTVAQSVEDACHKFVREKYQHSQRPRQAYYLVVEGYRRIRELTYEGKVVLSCWPSVYTSATQD